MVSFEWFGWTNPERSAIQKLATDAKRVRVLNWARP
jgi:hypothetical protein